MLSLDQVCHFDIPVLYSRHDFKMWVPAMRFGAGGQQERVQDGQPEERGAVGSSPEGGARLYVHRAPGCGHRGGGRRPARGQEVQDACGGKSHRGGDADAKVLLQEHAPG